MINEIEISLENKDFDELFQIALKHELIDLIYEYADTIDRMIEALRFFVHSDSSSIFEELFSKFKVKYMYFSRYALYYGKIEIVKYILKDLTPEEIEDNREHIIDLFNDAQVISFELVKHLLENGYIKIEDVDIYDAAVANKTSVVSYLVEMGADVNYNNGYDELMTELAFKAEMNDAFIPLVDYLRELE